jgi:hypothetical protein
MTSFVITPYILHFLQEPHFRVRYCLKNGCCMLTDGFVIPPTRWLVSIVTPLTFAAWGIRKKSLVMSGAVLGEYSIL